MKSLIYKKSYIILLLLSTLAYADYAITVSNGSQTLFQHPVSVELSAEQMAYVQAGAELVEKTADGPVPVPYLLDTTGMTPRLCWTLSGETVNGRDRVFLLGKYPVLTAKTVSKSDLECREQQGYIILSNSYFQVRHPLRGNGGFPQDIQYLQSGYTDSQIRFYDRLYHRDLGSFWAKNDHKATCEVILNTPQRVVVESRVHFVADDGTLAPGNPLAVYQYVYSPYSPVIEVRRTLTREDATQAWSEAHFLQTCRYERFYTTIQCGEPLKTTTAGDANADPRSFSFSQWGIYASLLGAYGLGGTQGGGYDRGRHGFPSNVAAQNLGYKSGETEKGQIALLYFGPAKADGGWYNRWLGSGRPEITIQPLEAASENAPEVSEIALDCHGMKIYFANAEQGFGCLGVENLLGEEPVCFVFPHEAKTPLWRIAFKKPYAVRQQEINQPGFVDTVWLNSLEPDASSGHPTMVKGSSGELVFTWQGLNLPGEPGVVDVSCTITPSPNRPEALWHIQVTNRSQAWGLAETYFPILAQVIRPGQGDALLPDSNWGHRLYHNSTTQVEQAYPGYKCMMQFMAFNQKEAGLYFAAHDPGARPKHLIVTNAQDATFRVFAENYAQPGTGCDAEFSFCLAAYQGDWWKAAKRYREWAIAEAPWTAKGPIATREDFPRSLVDASFWQRLDSRNSCDQVGTRMEELHARIDYRPGFALHWYCWHQIPFDNSYPEYFPVREGFEANVRRLTSQGMLVMPYINARLWDVDIPSFDADARNAAALPEHGEPSHETYGSGRFLTPMCPYTTLWQNKLDEITTRLMDEYHVSGIYLDQIGCAGPELCFNPTHGHPLGGGTHWVDGYRKLLSRIKAKAAPKGVFLTMEAGAEPYIDNIDGNLICTQRFQEEVPTLAAVYSGYTIYFSLPNHPRDDIWAFRANQARDFLWGCQPGWNSEWIADDVHRDYFAYEAYLGHLQQAAKEFFREGELLCEQRPANNPGEAMMIWHHKTPHQATLQAIQGYWWKAPDGRLLLALANLSPDVRRFVVQNADLASLSGQTPKTLFLAERFIDSGAAPLRETGAVFSHSFTLEAGEVYLVTFTPADKTMLKNARKHAEKLAFDEKAAPELRNAAAEYLFHTEYGLEFTPDAEITAVPGYPVDYFVELSGKPPKNCEVILPDHQCFPAQTGRRQHLVAFKLTQPENSAFQELHSDNPALARGWAIPYCQLRIGNLVWNVPVHCRAALPVEMTLGEVPEIRAGQSFLLPVTLESHQQFSTSGAIRLNVPDNWEVEPSRLIAYWLEPGKPFHTQVRITVPSDEKADAAAFMTTELISNRQTVAFTIQPPRSLMVAPKATQPIDVATGTNWPENSTWTKLGENLPSSIKIPGYHGNDDCSGRMRCAWDEQFFYLQAEVTDDVHCQKVATEKLWGGDCVQIALHPGKPNLSHGYDGREREVGLALTENGFCSVYQWMGGATQGFLENASVAIRREGNITTYCVAIPWSDFLMSSPHPGETANFSFTFNDNDGDGLRGWLEWTPGICGGKDSSPFGELRFEK